MLVVAATALVGAPILLGTANADVTFVVTSTNDDNDALSADGICLTSAGECTLRAAIQQANALSGNDIIQFAILPAGGVKTINLGSALPNITENVTINGITQSGGSCAAPFTPTVLVNGNNVNGAILQVTGGRLLTQGVIWNRGAGGSTATIILGTSNNVIQCTFIGTNTTGTATQTGVAGSPNGAALRIEGSFNNIGGSAPDQRNIIGDETGIQIQIMPGSNNNQLFNNSIGVSPTGTPITHTANWFQGIYVEGNDNTIGGRSLGQPNIIANMNAPTAGDGNGVWVAAGTGNRVVANSIYNNVGLGIKIDNGNNEDIGDGDTGANLKQNAPVMSTAFIDAGGLLNLGSVTDTPSGGPFGVDYFKTDGTNNQGKFYVASFTSGTGTNAIVPTNAAGLGVNIGDQIVATVHDLAGNSSQFSTTPITVTGPPGGPFVVNSTDDSPDDFPGNGFCLTDAGFCSLRAAIEEANAYPGADTINFAVSGTITTGSTLSITGDVTIDGSTAPGANCDQWPPVPTVTVANQIIGRLINSSGGSHPEGTCSDRWIERSRYDRRYGSVRRRRKPVRVQFLRNERQRDGDSGSGGHPLDHRRKQHRGRRSASEARQLDRSRSQFRDHPDRQRKHGPEQPCRCQQHRILDRPLHWLAGGRRACSATAT